LHNGKPPRPLAARQNIAPAEKTRPRRDIPAASSEPPMVECERHVFAVERHVLPGNFHLGAIRTLGAGWGWKPATCSAVISGAA
jgi:hypothetical protein